MKRFFISHTALVNSPTFFSFGDAVRLVEATNKRFAIWNDFKKLMLVVEAENKPENSPTHNVFWQSELG